MSFVQYVYPSSARSSGSSSPHSMQCVVSIVTTTSQTCNAWWGHFSSCYISVDDQAAVDVVGGAGDVAGVWPQQELHQRGHVLWAAHPVHDQFVDQFGSALVMPSTAAFAAE